MEKRNTIVSIIVIGSLWGMAEATLGYLAHVVSILTFYGISGMLMSAVAVYFMRMAVKTTNRVSSIFYVSLIAAGIKLFDLFLPFLPAAKTINPAIAIIAEGLALSVAWKLFFSHHRSFHASIFTGVSWRIIYLAGVAFVNVMINGHYTLPSTIFTYILSFILLQGLLNSLVIYPVLRAKSIKYPSRDILIRPEFAIVSFSIAVSLELLSRII